MCGIVLLNGPNARNRLSQSLNRLQHRGPDDQHAWFKGDLAFGFSRLAINGSVLSGRQPYRYGNFLGAFNGEIYNHRELALEHRLLPTTCDTHIILQLFERMGHLILDELDGFYSGVTHVEGGSEVFCLRDHIGKKPLFVGRSQSEIFITSELKALEAIDWFGPIPLGLSRVNLQNGQAEVLATHRRPMPQGTLPDILESAIAKRIPPQDQPVGVFLSGGLDSSIVARQVSRFRSDATYFTLGDVNGNDRQAVDSIVAALGLEDLRVVPLPSPQRLPQLLDAVVYATESFNPSIISNGLATYLLAEAAREANIKVVLTGEGADELFGGYHTFGENDPWEETRNRLINDMQFTELRRLDMSCMAHSVEARCPFLDRDVRSFSDNLSYDQMYHSENNKVILRRCFEGLLPSNVLNRRKVSFDVGSGIRGEIVRYLRRNGNTERVELKKIWQQCFRYDASNSYFHAYPVFDHVIDYRGETHR